jgi:hypothetical protein
LEEQARALADAIEAALAPWVIRSVERVMMAWAGEVPVDVARRAREAGEQARVETGGAVRQLLERDIDDQVTTPLMLLRAAVRWPTAVLLSAGVAPVVRDRFDERAFPEDLYGLTPARFADIEPDLADLGLAWGAAKAQEHRRRHGTG